MKNHVQKETEKLWGLRSKAVHEHKQHIDGFNTLGNEFFAELDEILAKPLDHFRKDINPNQQKHDHMRDTFAPDPNEKD